MAADTTLFIAAFWSAPQALTTGCGLPSPVT
jgi:hypothetical protein